MKKLFLIGFAIIYLVSFAIVSAHASGMQGCCSHHDGVVVVDGEVMCGDGSSLSDLCQSKLDKIIDQNPDMPVEDICFELVQK